MPPTSGLPADRRRLIRREKATPLIDELAAVLDAMLPKLPGKSERAAAIRYARNLWTALRRYLDDGRLEIDNNAAERQIRPLALGRKNYLFAGSDTGGDRAAVLYLDPNRQAQRPRSRSLPPRRAYPHRRPPHQSHRRPASLEHPRARATSRRRLKAILTPRSPQRRKDAYLGVDGLEVADHVHPEVPARRNRGSAHLRLVVRLARRLDEGVEAA